MEGHLPCLKFLVGEGTSPTHVLSARNDNGETPKMLAQQFYKDNILEYVNNIEWERDHPEEAESESLPRYYSQIIAIETSSHHMIFCAVPTVLLD